MVYAAAVTDALVRLLFRIPGPLHDRLKRWAERERRSLNAHLIYLMERADREWNDE